MFRNLRHGLGNARARLRARSTAGLFAFEFLVVVLGVMAAQGMQEWAQQRAQQRHVDAELERLRDSYVATVRLAEVWRSVIPCLRTRVEFLMHAAATGAPVTPELVRRPRLLTVAYPGTDVETETRLRAMLGTKAADTLLDAQYRAGNMDENMEAMLTRWEKFRLLDPAYGPISDIDRGTAREAGADLLMHLRSLEIAIINIDELRGPITIPDAPPPVAGDVIAVSSCAEVWKNGTAYREVK